MQEKRSQKAPFFIFCVSNSEIIVNRKTEQMDISFVAGM